MKLKSRFQVKDLSLCSSSAHCCLQIREEGCWVNLSFDNCHHALFPLGGLASRDGAASGKNCLERCVQEGDTLHGNAVLWNRRKPEESQGISSIPPEHAAWDCFGTRLGNHRRFHPAHPGLLQAASTAASFPEKPLWNHQLLKQTQSSCVGQILRKSPTKEITNKYNPPP